MTNEIQTQREFAKNTLNLRSLPTLVLYNTQSQDWYKIPGRYELDEIAPTFEIINERERK